MDEQLFEKIFQQLSQTNQADSNFKDIDDLLINQSSGTGRDNNITDKICSRLSQYSFDKLYRWLASVAVLPQNQMFEIRFEIILSCLVSIPEKKFLNKKLDHKKFCQLISTIDALISPCTIGLEDFVPFPQLKKIPLFTQDNTYYFFYGSYEQPYLNWSRLMECFYPILKKVEHPLAQIIDDSLHFQTSLLEEIEKFYSSAEMKDDIFIPSEQLLNSLGNIFITTIGPSCTRVIKAGQLATQSDILNLALNDGMRTVFTVKSKQKKYYWLPFDHYDGLLSAVKELIKTASPIIKSINIYSVGKFTTSLWGLFKLPRGVRNIYSLKE